MTVTDIYEDTRAAYRAKPYAFNVRQGDIIEIHRHRDRATLEALRTALITKYEEIHA